jgi:predicted DNA-binding protein with PD1-like motif
MLLLKSASPITPSSRNFLNKTPIMDCPSSGSRAFAFRLKPKDDLKKSILAFAEENKIKAGSIVTGAGSLEQFRFANQKKGEVKKGFFEMASLTGTFSGTSCHLHLSVSDHEGKTLGGLLLDDNIIYTTAEVTVIDLTELEFKRAPEATYGFNELVVGQRKHGA